MVARRVLLTYLSLYRPASIHRVFDALVDKGMLAEPQPKIICDTIGVGEFGVKSTLMACELETGLTTTPAKPPCKDIIAPFDGGRVTVKACLANCKACTPTAAQQVAIDKVSDARCATICSMQGSCPPGKKCVRDQVINKKNVPKCLDNSNGCTRINPKKPAVCLRIESIAECTCKCV